MRESQRAVLTAIETWIVDNVPAASTLFTLLCAGVMVAASFRYRTPPWRATTIRIMGLVLAFCAIAVQVGRNDWLTDVDYVVTDWIVAHRSPVLDIVMLGITSLFGPAATIVVTGVVAAGIGWRRRSALTALTVIGTVSGAAAAGALIKLLVGRPRPPLILRETVEQGYSFPSGHVTAAAALFGIAAVMIGGRSRILQPLLAGIGGVAVCLVALSRIYLGVHWLSDVVAGALLGAVAVCLATAALHIDRWCRGTSGRRRTSLARYEGVHRDRVNESMTMRHGSLLSEPTGTQGVTMPRGPGACIRSVHLLS
ncbi:phosphatase PAP2 family protein [Mycobacterium sp. 155]|uniref:phosphatase PAP2 family protein n=1 Tax=Mycobacterium sp. 155 TaxID=1157943 RepID=UPI00035CEA67|nr:phosphatase PAP2 family protein [Mycobacterium sp. 155]